MPLKKSDENPYTAGIVVKISEKFKRPPKLHLPSCCQNGMPPFRSEQYDFNFDRERSILSKMEDWKKAKDDQIHRREERQKSWETLIDEGSSDNAKESACEEPSPVTSAPIPNPPSNILTPIFASNNTQPIHKPAANFNFSEFESDNSSPFDNMELKTINDMEVLASVLGSTKLEAAPENKPNYGNNNSISNRNGYVWNQMDGYSAYTSPTYYNLPNNYGGGYRNVQYQQPNVAQWATPSTTITYQPLSPPLANATPSSTLYPSTSQSKSNSKSVPDLVLEVEKELKDKKEWNEQKRKTQTPPPRPTLLKSSGLENWKPWPELESPRQPEPDSIESLPSSSQPLAQSFTDMGFPHSRVVRTIRRFNEDDKKVIEFLLQVQRLEEKKLPGDLVERALHATNYDESEAVKHVAATAVLLDLGFESDKVERVLLECNNDRDAALERLIS